MLYIIYYLFKKELFLNKYFANINIAKKKILLKVVIAMLKKADGLVTVFNTVIEEYQGYVDKIAKKYDLYVGQTEILFLLDDKTGRTQKELAQEIGVSKATVGVSLRRMEQTGLVNRIVDSKDARCIRVSLTDKGMRVCEQCKVAYEEAYKSMFAGLIDKKRQEAFEFLEKMGKGLATAKSKVSVR